MTDPAPPHGPSTARPVRILFCSSGGLYGALVLARLLADPRVQLAGLVQSSRVLGRRDGWLAGVSGLYRRSGLRYLLYLWAATGMAELLGRLGALPPVRAQAAAAGGPVLVTADLNDATGAAFVDRCAPDLLVSAFFNQRIAPEIFQSPPAGAVNLHPSLLPVLKGVDPVFFARLRGVAALGVSLHRLAAELDSGPLLAQTQLTPAAGDSVLAVTAGSFLQGAELLLEQLEAVVAGAPGSPQAGAGDYDSWPTPAQVRDFHRRGGALLRFADLRLMLTGRR